ncbi:hypothetical protein [Kutzneria buriramensis]|uniref:Uncharacterized protein n=1 Tax=Kutzneria buriramensis TaxID=1045776 RepID=A0A3E0GWZ5_9PSEU|nr:hypothetical protein [Kutzneria buriramensis]REH28645.1 hypothetical protein BCF44_12687 [Kutzneria buriramensis]
MTMSMIDCVRTFASLADCLSGPCGGFTIAPTTCATITTGYAVSVHPEHEKIITRRVTALDLHHYVSTVRDALALPGRVFGGWRDPDTGSIYLDVSMVTPSLAEALELALRYDQLAVYDFATGESIPVTAPVPAAA